MLSATLMGQAATPTPAPVLVQRRFTPNEINSYRFSATLVVETQETGLAVALPSEVGYEYTFTTRTRSVDEDGIADLRYERGPTFRIDGAFGEQGGRRVLEAEGFTFDMKVTPINEILDFKEVKPPTRTPAPRTSNQSIRMMAQDQMSGRELTDIVAGQYIQDLNRLALFIGNFDSSFDFAPKFEDDPKKPGDTWLYTVSYQPQRLSGTGRTAVQRLDMRYRYDGPMTVNGKQIERVSATIRLDNDMAGFVAQSFGIPAAQNPFQSLRLQYNSDFTFDLEPKSFKILRAQALSRGSVITRLRGVEGNAAERRMTGESTLTLVGSRIERPTPARNPRTR